MAEKEIRFGNFQVVVNDPARYPQAVGKANAFATAIGPHSGLGYVLMKRSDLAQLDAGQSYDLKFTVSDGGNQSTTTFSDLVVDVGVKVGGGADGDDDSIYLVRLVDRRWHLTRYTSTFRRFNVRSWAGGEQLRYFDEKWIRETIKAPLTPWKNSEIVAFLWSDLGFAGPLPAFPTNDQGRPKIDDVSPVENVHFNGVSAWTALHDVLHQIGWTTALDHEKGAFNFVELGSRQDLSKLSNDAVVYSADRYSGGTTYAPERITVAFPTRYDDYGSERDTEVQSNWSTSWAAYAITLPTGATQAIAGSNLTIWDSTTAIRKHASWQIDNPGDLFSRALAIMLGYLGNNAQGTAQSSGDRAHTIVSGVETAARLGSRLKAIVVRDYGRDPNRGDGDGLVTELVRHPGWPSAARYFGEESLGGERSLIGLGFEFSDRVVVEHQDGLDLQRPSWANYPRLPNLVKLTKYKTDDKCCVEVEEQSSGEDNGDAREWAIPVDPLKKLFGGVVHRYDAATGFTALEECWVYFPNYPSDVFKIEKDAFYYARLSGQETSIIDGRKLPLYVATSHVRALPSWSNECLYLPDGENGEEFEHGFGACDVKTIAVDAASSLALYRRKLADADEDGEEDDAAKCKPSVGITIKGSPYPCAVFWTGEDSKTPKWTISPKFKTLQVKAGIEIGQVTTNDDGESEGSSVWLLPGGQSAKIKLPSNTPAGAGVALMTSGVDGECVATEWGPKGVTGDHDFVENVTINYSGGLVWLYGDCDCYIYQSPLSISLDVEKCPIETDRGIVVQLCDETPDSDQGSADCGDPKHCKPLDPCDPPEESASGKLTCCEDTASDDDDDDSTDDESLLPPIESVGDDDNVLDPI